MGIRNLRKQQVTRHSVGSPGQGQKALASSSGLGVGVGGTTINGPRGSVGVGKVGLGSVGAGKVGSGVIGVGRGGGRTITRWPSA